ncbi:MAG: hypothetical protein ACF8R9_07705 [Phycisphaerales bacterium JB054]
MAKKARKKTAKKTARKAGARKAGARKKVARKASAPRGGGGLRAASAGELQAELQRRSRDLATLEAKRDELLSKVDGIEAEIAAINGALGASTVSARGRRSAGRPRAGAPIRVTRMAGGRRPRNESSLEVALANTLKGKTMGVSEVAAAVQEAGYKTTSPNFRTIVNQTLIKSDLIKKIGRGQYTAK